MFITKRILIITGVIVAIVMLATGTGLAYAFTALGQQTAANAHLSATASAVVAVPSPKTGAHKITGVIQSLSTASFVILAGKNKKAITVNVDTTTKYTHTGKTAVFSDLQVGQIVAIMGTVDAKAKTVQATGVVISPKRVQVQPTTTPAVNPTVTATP
ncbi:MAG: DUF5666 domain-containing protein [Ktedonobacteraceae bacterium]